MAKKKQTESNIMTTCGLPVDTVADHSAKLGSIDASTKSSHHRLDDIDKKLDLMIAQHTELMKIVYSNTMVVQVLKWAVGGLITAIGVGFITEWIHNYVAKHGS